MQCLAFPRVRLENLEMSCQVGLETSQLREPDRPPSCATRCLFTSAHIVYTACHFDRSPVVGCKCVCVYAAGIMFALMHSVHVYTTSTL